MGEQEREHGSGDAGDAGGGDLAKPAGEPRPAPAVEVSRGDGQRGGEDRGRGEGDGGTPAGAEPMGRERRDGPGEDDRARGVLAAGRALSRARRGGEQGNEGQRQEPAPREQGVAELVEDGVEGRVVEPGEDGPSRREDRAAADEEGERAGGVREHLAPETEEEPGDADPQRRDRDAEQRAPRQPTGDEPDRSETEAGDARPPPVAPLPIDHQDREPRERHGARGHGHHVAEHGARLDEEERHGREDEHAVGGRAAIDEAGEEEGEGGDARQRDDRQREPSRPDVRPEEPEAERHQGHGQRPVRRIGRQGRVAEPTRDERAGAERLGGEAARALRGVELEGLAQAARTEGREEQRGAEAGRQAERQATADRWGHRRLLVVGWNDGGGGAARPRPTRALVPI